MTTLTKPQQTTINWTPARLKSLRTSTAWVWFQGFVRLVPQKLIFYSYILLVRQLRHHVQIHQSLSDKTATGRERRGDESQPPLTPPLTPIQLSPLTTPSIVFFPFLLSQIQISWIFCHLKHRQYSFTNWNLGTTHNHTHACGELSRSTTLHLQEAQSVCGGIVREEQKRDLFMGKSLNCHRENSRTGHWSLVCSTHTHRMQHLHIPLCLIDIFSNNSLGDVCKCVWLRLRSGSLGLWKAQ